MSDRMTVAEARETLNILDGRLPLTHASRAARTVVAQAEQIGRLQTALRKAEVARREVWVEYGVDIDPHGKVHWDAQYPGLLPGDMGEGA